MQSASLLPAGLVTSPSWLPKSLAPPTRQPLEEFSYGDIILASDLHNKQLQQTHSVLMELSEDSLLKPFRQMVGQPAPGEEQGGWYRYDPNYDWHTFDAGFAPAATFGQWVSPLDRTYAITGEQQTHDKVFPLHTLHA